MILTLSLLPLLVIHYGSTVLDKIHSGRFDEADIKIQEIPEIIKNKANLGLLCNDFFGDLIFIMQLPANEYSFQLLENHILNSTCSEKEYCDMVLQYVGIQMLRQKRLPWEIEYCLRNIMNQQESMKKIVQRYKQEEYTYEEYVKWYQERLSCNQK